MKVIQALERYIVKVETLFLVTSLLVMVLLAFLQVFLRNIFSSGFLWADTFLRYLVVWVGFIGAAIASSEEKHISIEVLTKFISPKAKNVVSIVTGLAAAIVCYYLFSASNQFLDFGLSPDSLVFESIPLKTIFIIIPYGFLLMMFHFSVRVVSNFHLLFSNQKPEAI